MVAGIRNVIVCRREVVFYYRYKNFFLVVMQNSNKNYVANDAIGRNVIKMIVIPHFTATAVKSFFC